MVNLEAREVLIKIISTLFFNDNLLLMLCEK